MDGPRKMIHLSMSRCQVWDTLDLKLHQLAYPEDPYRNLIAANNWMARLKKQYGFQISSMQSIWFGRSEKVFGSDSEKNVLIDYTKHAILFAEAINCKNLVFGCPKNRSIPDGAKLEDSIPFFRQIGDYATAHNCVIAMEANPPIYNTNFINTTRQAFDLIKMVDSSGFLLNLDIGAMVENKESISILRGNEKYIHHVHISEPGLKPIEKRKMHTDLAEMLKDIDYKGFVSIEMSKQENIEALISIMNYVKKTFQ